MLGRIEGNNIFFRLDLRKNQLECLTSFLHVQQELDGRVFGLSELARLARLDYISVLHREKSWLLKFRILVEERGGLFRVDFDNLAYVLFTLYNTRVWYDFAMQFDEPPRKVK